MQTNLKECKAAHGTKRRGKTREAFDTLHVYTVIHCIHTHACTGMWRVHVWPTLDSMSFWICMQASHTCTHSQTHTHRHTHTHKHTCIKPSNAYVCFSCCTQECFLGRRPLLSSAIYTTKIYNYTAQLPTQNSNHSIYK